MATSLPEYYWPIMGDETITQETALDGIKLGPYAVRVVAPTAAYSGNRATDPPQDPIIGSGIVSSPIPVQLEEGFPFVSEQARLWVVSGRVRMELWDVSVCDTVIIWPPRYSNKRVVTEEIGNWIENLEYHPGENFYYIHNTLLGGVPSEFQLVLCAEDANTEFVVDGLQLVNLAEGAATFWEGSASNDLWKAALDLLKERSILDGVTRYAFEMADLDRLGLSSNEDVAWGADVDLSDSRFGITATRRIVEYTKQHLRLGETSVLVDRDPKRLTKDVAFNPRRDLRAVNPEEVNAPTTPQGLKAEINANGNLVFSWESATGANYYQVREAGNGATDEARWASGRIIEGGERVATTQFIIADPEPRPYDIMVRAYTESGRPSRGVAVSDDTIAIPSNTIAAPSDLDLALYLAFDERDDMEGETLRPQQGDLRHATDASFAVQPAITELQRRRRWDQSQYGNHFVAHYISQTVAQGHPALQNAESQSINPNAPGVANHSLSSNDGVEDESLHPSTSAYTNPCGAGTWPTFDDLIEAGDEDARYHRSEEGFMWGSHSADVRVMEQFYFNSSTGMWELDPVKNGHFGFDFETDFTICGWITPCIINWDNTWTVGGLNSGEEHQYTILGRFGRIGMGFDGSDNLSAAGTEHAVLRGWRLTIGGMSWINTTYQHDDVADAWYRDPNQLAIVFTYLPNHTNPNSVSSSDLSRAESAYETDNCYSLSWPWDYTGGNYMDAASQYVQITDTIQGSGPYCNYLYDDARLFANGLYCPWSFVALVVSPELTDSMGVPNGLCDFTVYAGFADRGLLYNLGTKTASKMKAGMWTSNLASPTLLPEWVVPTLTDAPFYAYADDGHASHGAQVWDVGNFDEGDENGLLYGNNKLGVGPSEQICRRDELRCYHRALRQGEIEWLYLHPGGMKRAENTVEAIRQVNQP